MVALELFTRSGGIFLSRYAHYLAGITWIGLLYYFNFVQTPSLAAFEAAPRVELQRKLLGRALWWFRWGAMLTVLTGFMILGFQKNFDGDYMKSPAGVSILTDSMRPRCTFCCSSGKWFLRNSCRNSCWCPHCTL